MSKIKSYGTYLTDVKNFSGNFDTVTISARPQFTGDFRTTLTQNFSAVKSFDGYNFDTVTSVMLSTTDDVNIFDADYTLSAYNFYNTLTSVSTNSTPSLTIKTNYPEVSGFPITTYKINNKNTLTITFPTVTASGTVDIIAINPAGYGIFGQDVTSVNGIIVS